MSYRQVYNPGYAMNGHARGLMDSRGFAIPYVDNGGPAVFSSNSSHVQRNSYRQPLRSSYTRSYQLHPTIPEVLPPSTPPPPPPLPPLRSNFHPTRNLYKPVSIKRPSVKQQRQPPAPPPPPPPPTTMAYIHPLTSPRSMPHPTQPPPPPPPESSSLSSSSSTTNEDQHRSMEDMIDAAGPPDYDSDSDNAESDEGDDNNESSTNRDSEVEDTPSERVEQETETQTQNFGDDENDDGNDDSGNDQNDFDNDEHDDRNEEEGSGIDQNEGEQTVITHDAGVGTDDIDRPPSRHVTIHENHNDLGWQRRSQRSQMEWDEVEAPWARLSGRQLSGRRFREDRQHPRHSPPPRKEPRVEDRSKHRRENHYHVHESDRNGNIVDPRLPIINSVYSRPYPDNNGVHQKRNKPRAMYYDNPQFINERTIRYEPRQTYIPPRNEMMYQQQRRLVDTRRKPRKEKSSLAACTGCCVIMLLTFAFLVLVALCAVLAYYYVVFDENTTDLPNDDLSNEEIGLLAGAIGAGVLALLFLIIMILMACVNLFSSRNDLYKI